MHGDVRYADEETPALEAIWPVVQGEPQTAFPSIPSFLVSRLPAVQDSPSPINCLYWFRTWSNKV